MVSLLSVVHCLEGLSNTTGAGAIEQRQIAARPEAMAMSSRQCSQAHLGVQHELQLAAELAQARAVLRAPLQCGAAVAPRQTLQDGVRVRKDVHIHQLLHQADTQRGEDLLLFQVTVQAEGAEQNLTDLSIRGSQSNPSLPFSPGASRSLPTLQVRRRRRPGDRAGKYLYLALAAQLHSGAVIAAAQHVVGEDAVHARVVPQRGGVLLRQPDLRQVPQPRPAPPRLCLLHSRCLVELHSSAEASACASVFFMHPSRTLKPPRRSFMDGSASESGTNVSSLGGMQGHAGCAGDAGRVWAGADLPLQALQAVEDA